MGVAGFLYGAAALYNIIQIFTAHEGNGAKYLPKVTEDRGPSIFPRPKVEGK